MKKRIYIIISMLIIVILSILKWGISFSSLFLIIGMFFIYMIFPMKELSVKNKSINKFYKIYKSIIILFISSFLLLEGMILFNINEFKNIDKLNNIDTIIVLGSKVNGSEISNNLKLRLDKTIEYYNRHKDINIIVSGGKENNSNITEALAMQKYLVDNGVNKNNIIKEDKATSTFENIIYSKEILDNINHKGKVIIVTSDFHLFRGRLIASILDIENKGLCSTSKLSTRIYYMIREYPSIIVDFTRSIIYKYKYII